MVILDGKMLLGSVYSYYVNSPVVGAVFKKTCLIVVRTYSIIGHRTFSFKKSRVSNGFTYLAGIFPGLIVFPVDFCI